MKNSYRFDDVDMQQLCLVAQLPAHKRILLMLNARELAVGFIRGRLHRQHPTLSRRDLNLKVLEEIERAKNRTCPQFNSIPRRSVHAGED